MPDNDDFISGLLNERAVESLNSEAIAPSFPASDEGLEVTFFDTTHSFFRAWLADKGGSKVGAAPCAIVLSRAIMQDIERLSAKRLWYFASSADVRIEGKILIANNDLSIVAEVPSIICSDSQQVGDALDNLGLADFVHCMLRGGRAEMHLCSSGLNGGSTLLHVNTASSVQLDSTAIDVHLWDFHRTFTQTSSGILRPWKDAANRITINEAEIRISVMLGFILGTIVGPGNVSVEEPTPHGRMDIKISEHAMSDGLGACALECKVLRSREASGSTTRSVSDQKMIEHASDGIQQAVEYRKDIKGKLAYLCCFDARGKDEDQPEVKTLAAQKDVLLRRYYMYSSPSAHRSAEAAATAAGKVLSGAVA